MSKHVLILSSTPRKHGNSDLLCDRFMDGALEVGHTVEKITLRDKNIRYCTGCGVCNETHCCVQKDDMADILEKMLAADVIVLSTPVYFYTMCAQLKTLIDRTVPKYTQLTDKQFYFILTAAENVEKDMQRTVESLRAFTEDCLEGAREMGIVYGLGAWKVGEIKTNPAMTQAYEMGKSVS